MTAQTITTVTCDGPRDGEPCPEERSSIYGGDLDIVWMTLHAQGWRYVAVGWGKHLCPFCADGDMW